MEAIQRLEFSSRNGRLSVYVSGARSGEENSQFDPSDLFAFGPVSVVLSVSLAANAPLAALADAGSPDRRIAIIRAVPFSGPNSAELHEEGGVAGRLDSARDTRCYRQIPANATPALANCSGRHRPPPALGEGDPGEMFWESAQKSNSVADYKAYLDAFPNGVYAPLAKNRIAAMSAQPDGRAAPRPGREPPGGQPTERDRAVRRRAQSGSRHHAKRSNRSIWRPKIASNCSSACRRSGVYNGPTDGNLGAAFRAAMGNWQRQHQLAPTGWLGPVQLSAVKAESDAVAQQRPRRPGRRLPAAWRAAGRRRSRQSRKGGDGKQVLAIGGALQHRRGLQGVSRRLSDRPLATSRETASQP